MCRQADGRIGKPTAEQQINARETLGFETPASNLQASVASTG
jgi:hypothetical protein